MRGSPDTAVTPPTDTLDAGVAVKSGAEVQALDDFEWRTARVWPHALLRLSRFERKLKRLSERAIDERGAEPWFRATPIQRAYTRRIFNAAGSMCDRSLACHDVGCGIGQCLAELQHLGFHVLYGCDVDEAYVDISRWVLGELHVPACLTVRDGCDYVARLAPSEAGMVLMLNWTYRLKLSEFLHLLKNARSALDPAGVLFVDVMRRDWPAQMGMEQDAWYQNYPLNWSGSEAQVAFASLGFHVLSCWGRFSFARQVYALTVSR